jgi:hypothetical protein
VSPNVCQCDVATLELSTANDASVVLGLADTSLVVCGLSRNTAGGRTSDERCNGADAQPYRLAKTKKMDLRMDNVLRERRLEYWC